VCDISSENYGKYGRQSSHNHSSRSLISAFPFTPTQFTKEKERGSPSILSESSLFSSQMSFADDEDVVIKKSRNSRKRSNYYGDKRKKSGRNNVSDDNHVNNNNNDIKYGNNEKDDKNDRNERNERNERKERRTSIVSKDDEEVKM
jgi:hypothetical protein